MGMNQEQLDRALQGLSHKVDQDSSGTMTQGQLDTALSSLNESTFSDTESDKVKASRQQEGESNFAFASRHIADTFERGITSGADAITPDDAIDNWRGVTTRGIDPNESYIHQAPSRFMTGSELSGHRDSIRNLLFSGSEPLPPTGDDLTLFEQTIRFIGAGTEAATDLTNLSTSGPRIAGNMMQSILPAAVADLVVQKTANAISDTDMSSSTKQSVLMALGVASGLTTGIVTSPVTATYQGYKNVKNLSVTKGVETHLTGEQQRFAASVVESQQDFYKIMERAEFLQDAMGGEPLKIVPIVAALQNDIMKGKFLEYYSDGRNPAFRAKIDEAVSEFVTRQDAYIKNLTTPAAVEGVTLPTVVVREQAKRLKFEEARQANIQKQIDGVDAQMAKVTSALSQNGSSTDIGQAAKTLLDTKRNLVRKRFKPLYEDWKKTETANGTVMPTEQVSVLLDWINELPTDEGRFLKNFSPLLDVKRKTKVETTTTQGLFVFSKAGEITQKPDTTETSVVDSYTPADVMQLKTMVNGRIRDLEGVTDSSGVVQRRLLGEFKSVLNGAIDEMPNGAGIALREIDKMYYTDMGIPFNSAGVAKMSVNKFTSVVAADLTKLQNARDFLGAAGEGGVPVLKDAIYTRIHSMAIKGNDVANEKLINNWLANKDNAALVDLVPNLRAELTDATTAIANSRLVKARMETEYKTNAYQATDDFLESVGKGGLDTTVGNLIKSEGTTMGDLIPLLDHMDPESTMMFKTGIRLKLVDRALKSKMPLTAGGTKHNAVNYVNSNRAVFTEFFGAGYVKDLEGALEMFDIVSTIDTANVPFRTNTLNNELFQASTGMGLSGYASAHRRYSAGITSGPQVLLATGSKIAQNKLDQKYRGRVMDLIFDPSIVAQIAKEHRSYKEATGTAKMKAIIKGVLEIVGRNSLRGSYIGGREATLDQLGHVTQEEQQALEDAKMTGTH